MNTLPDLPYEYNALEPYIDEQTMRLHHDKHHAGYVKGANLAIEKLAEARKNGDTSGVRAWTLALSFNLSGHLLHSLFWEILGPQDKLRPEGRLLEMINESFVSFEAFMQEFKAVAMSIEGSGWAVLLHDETNNSLFVAPIEKHNMLGITGLRPIMAIDVWEHAYYLKYQNDKKAYVESFDKVINWDAVESKLS